MVLSRWYPPRLVVMVLALIAAAGVCALAPSPAVAADTMLVCPHQGVPQGMVVTSVISTGSCPGSLDNGWRVRFPDWVGGTQICAKVSPIPQGYVVTAQTDAYMCPGQLNNGLVIRTPNPYSVTLVCAGISPIPVGYVITAQTESWSCRGYQSGWQIRLPNGFGATTVCPVSPIPPGYRVIGRTTSGNCHGAFDNALRILNG